MKLLCSLMFLEILLPVISIFLFALCVGNKPHGLKAALYNEERLNNATPFHMRMSEILIQKIKENSEVFILVRIDSSFHLLMVDVRYRSKTIAHTKRRINQWSTAPHTASSTLASTSPAL